ncbi:MAG: xanthine dehydrogenase accessory protein XdhC [Deltaproteobacteria bacterium]|nr:xanthine dehydrogenase accessory protein XdhC [Deltaproteobacteria bacterium]
MTDLDFAARALRAREPLVCVTVVDTGGSTPRLCGAQMWVTAGAQRGTVGGGAFEHLAVQRARALLAAPGRAALEHLSAHLTHDLGMCCGGKMTATLLRYSPPPLLVLCGAGHVSAALAAAAAAAGFDLLVLDARPEWARADRFPPGADVRCEPPEDELRASPPPPGAFVVVLTHDHALDERLVALLAPRRAAGALRFLGLIGSAGKWGRFARRLAAAGLPPEALALVRCPVGVAIHAETPEEIAVSVCAELIAVKNAPAALDPAPAPE